mmetsp:Transcript_12572/g.32178  ORF Transcript_12572/g.32178 Transcript_12572/m.32178 type:complete len:184 (+) Transcript_12572:1010-1561(+)
MAVLSLANLREPPARDASSLHSEYRRFILSAAGTATATIIPLADSSGAPNTGAELPSINPSFEGRQHCFVYFWAVQLGGEPSWAHSGILKKNVCAAEGAEPVRYWQRPGHFPGEPTFVPTPGGSDEDDGILLVATHDGADRDYLLVLNASSMQTLAEIRRDNAATPQRLIAFGIHGRFFADTS